MTVLSSSRQKKAEPGIPVADKIGGKRIRVLYVLPPTGKFAGIERVVNEIADGLARRYPQELSVDVLLLGMFDGWPEAAPAYSALSRRVDGPLSVMKVIRETVRNGQYDLVVVPQVEASVITWLSCVGLGPRIAMYLHGNPKFENTHFKASVLFMMMQLFVLQRLSAVFCISPKQMSYFQKAHPSKVPHFWVPNPVRRFMADGVPAGPVPDVITFVNVGRFCRQKGQDILLSAFAKVHARRPQARLVIVGYGDEEKQVLETIERLGLQGIARIEHHPHNPSGVLKSSDVYVSSSRWEGWSLAICEALRFGLPVVATDCEFGPSDILTDQKLGRLSNVESEDELVANMLYYCDHLEQERTYAEYRREYIDRYDLDNVLVAHADALALAVS